MTSHCEFLDAYLNLYDNTESPVLAHRWSILTSVASMLHRRVKFPTNIGDIYPNMFTILIGSPGSRKTTAIDLAVGLVQDAGYKNISSGKTSPEQFLLDLKSGFANAVAAPENTLDLDWSKQPLGSELSSNALIHAGELQNYLGSGNVGFITQLTDLWDNKATVPYRLRDGTAEVVVAPTVSLLGGATETTFKRVFPVDILGQGLLSRFILVYCGDRRKKVFDPEAVDLQMRTNLVEYLNAILYNEITTELKYDSAAYDFSRILYESAKPEIYDDRFSHYQSRRYNHYVKLCLTIATLNLHPQITLDDCFYANSILSYTEKYMPLALGEFGQDKEAEKTEALFRLLLRFQEGLTVPDIATKSLNVFQGSTSAILSHLAKLRVTKRVDQLNVGGITKFIAVQRVVGSNSKLADFSILKEYNEDPAYYNSVEVETTEDVEAEMIRQYEAETGQSLQPLTLGSGSSRSRGKIQLMGL